MVVIWDVLFNCFFGYGIVFISRDGRIIIECVSFGWLKFWGKKVVVFFNVRELVYVKLCIIFGNGIFMSLWVKLRF